MSSCAVSPSLGLIPDAEVKEAISPGARAQIHGMKDKVVGATGNAVKGAAGAMGRMGTKAINATGAGIENLANKRLHSIDRSAAVKDPMQRRQLATDMKAQSPNSVTPHISGVTRRGAATAGALIGGGLGFLNPGTDEEGNTKSRMMSAASGAATGGTLGFGAGHLMRGHANKNLKQQYDMNAAAPKPAAPAIAAPQAPASSPAALSPAMGNPAVPPQYPIPEHARPRSQF